MVEAKLESLQEWVTDHGLDLGPDSNLSPREMIPLICPLG
jgi:hypothetical protein